MIVSPIDSNTTGGPGGEDRRVAAHHREVGDRRDERAVPGRRAEHRGHERHPAGAPRLGEHVGRGRRAVAAPVGAEAGAFEHHDQRHAVGDRDLGDAVALGVGGRADRAGLHREVLGRDHHRPAVDAARTHHDRVGGRFLAADERAELLERTGVEEVRRCARGRRACRRRGACAAVRRRPSRATPRAGAARSSRTSSQSLGRRTAPWVIYRPVNVGGRRSM